MSRSVPDGTAWQDHAFEEVTVKTFEDARQEVADGDGGTARVYRAGAWVDDHVPVYGELTVDPDRRSHAFFWGSGADYDAFTGQVGQDEQLGVNPDVVVVPRTGSRAKQGTFFDYRHRWRVDAPDIIEFAHGVPAPDAPSDYYSRGWSAHNAVNTDYAYEQVLRRDAGSDDIVQHAVPHMHASTVLPGETVAASLLAVKERLDGQGWIREKHQS